MRKGLSYILVFAIAVTTLFFPFETFAVSEAAPSEEYDELIQLAKISTDIPIAEDSSIEYLREHLYDSGIPNENVDSKVMERSEFRFPYHIEFDFGTRKLELAYIVWYSDYTLERGVTNIDFEYWNDEGEKWVKVLKSYDMNYLYAGYEPHIINLPLNVKASKYRVCINAANIELGTFRIYEMQMYGKIVGYSDVDGIAAALPNYTLMKVGETTSYRQAVEVLTDSGKYAAVRCSWPKSEIMAEEGLHIRKGTVRYYGGESVTVFDVYDDTRIIAEGEGSWAAESIEKAKKLGWLGGIYKGAEQSLTRAETAKILFRATGGKLRLSDGSGFTDVKETAIGYIVNSLKNKGTYEGIAEDTFEENRIVSRIEAVKSIMNLKGGADSVEVGFSDVSDEEKALLSRAAACGIISDGSSFLPKNGVTLAELATMLLRYADDKTVLKKNYADTAEAVINPGMGIFSYYLDATGRGYDIFNGPDDNYEDLEGHAVVYLRTFWSCYNPAEDVYDFSQLDALIQRLAKQNKQISLRFLSYEGIEYAVPKWVYDKGINYYKWDYLFSEPSNRDHPREEEGWYYTPDYEDPEFFKYEKKFFKELGRRYDGHPQIASVEMGIGLWGEGHMGSRLPDYSVESFLERMEMLRECLPNTQLCILNETEKGMGNDEKKWNTVKEKARELEIGYRNDTYYGNPLAHTPWMWLVTEAHDAAKFSEWGPVIMELDHYSAVKNKGLFGNDKIGIGKSIPVHRASYMGMHGPIRQMYEENPEFMEYCWLNLGYRFIPESVEIPANMVRGKSYDIKVLWKNVGSAKCYTDYYPAITLTDQNGNIAYVTVDTDFSVKQLEPPEILGAQGLVTDDTREPAAVTAEAMRFKLDKSVGAGEYKAYISLGYADGAAAVMMPIDGNNGEKLYYIGDITVR